MAAGLLLAGAALVGTLLLGFANWHSQPFIEDNRRQALLDQLQVVIPASRFDNDLLSDTATFADSELLGMDGEIRVYRARKSGLLSAAAFRVVAPDGYAGDVVLLMAVDAHGAITGVRVLSHRETPGLGDDIEAARSNWIDGFIGKSLQNPSAGGWRVRRDGGEFDQFTGATITPRAVVGAVHRGLMFFDRYRLQISGRDLPTATATTAQEE